MNEAAALARAGDPGDVWIVTDRQTGGRGRHGRAWVSEPGNLYATLLLMDPCPIERAPQLSFVTALALLDALRALAIPNDRIKVKWPNDVLVDGAKITGVLLEGLPLNSSERRKYAVAIGCGVNVRHHPEGLAYRTTDLAALGVSCEPLDVLRELSRALRGRIEQWAAGDNFPAIRSDWLRAAAGLGEHIKVTLPDRVVEGVFLEIDPAGRLVVDAGKETLTVDAGDVALRREIA